MTSQHIGVFRCTKKTADVARGRRYLTVNVDGKIGRGVFDEAKCLLDDTVHANVIDLVCLDNTKADIFVNFVILGALQR